MIILSAQAFAYVEHYPPYLFKEDLPKSAHASPLLNDKQSEFKSDGILARQTEDSFLLKDGGIVLLDLKGLSFKNAGDTPYPMESYRLDVDGNGLKDFVVFSWWGGAGLASFNYRVDIFLKEDERSYQRISYDTMNPDMKDFADLNHDGKLEVIITGYYPGQKHNYFSYNVYQFKDFKLVNSDHVFKHFPKFVWLTDKPNDKDTTHLSKKEREGHTLLKNQSIKYREMV
jgi:hypothetical protein